MADILIRGMDKPHNCFHCDLSYLRGERLFCHVTKDEVLRSKIAPDCPIQELPEHGDLIDASKLIPIYEEMKWSDDYCMECMKGAIWEVEQAPVIVPSNKEETE